MRRGPAKVNVSKPDQLLYRADVTKVFQLGCLLPEGILLVEENSVKDYLVLEDAHPRSNYRSAFWRRTRSATSIWLSL